MPEFGARPLVWADGEVLHSCLNLKAIRNSWFQGNACLQIQIKQLLRNGSAFLTSILIDLGISTSSDVSWGAGENLQVLYTQRKRGSLTTAAESAHWGGDGWVGSIKHWVSCGKFSAWVQNFASPLILNQKQEGLKRASKGLVRQLAKDLNLNRKPLWKGMQLLLDTVNFWITRFGFALGHSKNPGISKPVFPFASGRRLPKPALWRSGTVMRAPQLFTCLSGWWVLWSLCFSFCFLVMRQPFLTGDRDQLWQSSYQDVWVGEELLL